MNLVKTIVSVQEVLHHSISEPSKRCGIKFICGSWNLGVKHAAMGLEYAITLTQIFHHLISSSLTSIADDTKRNFGCTTMVPSSALLSIDQVFTLLYEYLPALMNYNRKTPEQAKDYSVLDDTESQLQSLLVKLGQSLTNTQSKHPVPFARYLDPFLNLFYGDLTHTVSNVESQAIQL